MGNRCRRIPTEVEADEKADSLKKALAAGIVSGIGKRDDKEENTEEDIQYTYTEGEIKTYRIFDNDGKLKERKSWRKPTKSEFTILKKGGWKDD